jgi:lactoylglutathione lyase
VLFDVGAHDKWLTRKGNFATVAANTHACADDTWKGPEDYAGGRNFGHLAIEVDDVYGYCEKLQKSGITINRPPRDGRMAFVRSPDNISIELLQKGGSLPPAEPWASMRNTGEW